MEQERQVGELDKLERTFPVTTWQDGCSYYRLQCPLLVEVETCWSLESHTEFSGLLFLYICVLVSPISLVCVSLGCDSSHPFFLLIPRLLPFIFPD